LLLIETAMSAGEWHRAIEISGELISSGVRTPDALFLRASSLANAGPTGDSVNDEARLRDVERLSTELLEAIGDDTHPFFTKALVLRSVSRRFLGREEEAAADLARATELQSGDPDAIRHAALARLSMDDPEGAVALLRHPATENDLHLLALRAEALASIPDEVGARSDIARALAQAPDAASPDMVRLTAATAAINLTDPRLAEQALQGVSDSARSSFQGLLLRGRIAFLCDDISNGLQLFREASARNANARIGVLAELGYHLLRADRPSDAIEVYRELGDDSLPANAASFLARALFLTDNFAEAQRLIDRLAQKAPLPEWALAMSADIAHQQENAQGAAEHLKVLVERTGDQGVRLELVRRLHELGRYAEAAPYLASLVASPAKPVQRMALAQLLSGVGRQQEALSIAFRAFRDAPSDARMHRAFVMLALAQGAVPTHDTIGADTYVRLKRPGGAERSYTIYADGPIDRLRQEISLDDARTLGLLNKRVGDVIASAVDQWHEGDWIVDEIKPAIVHVVQDAMMNYEARFSNEPFFIKAFSIGDGTSVRDFAPMVASLEGRREHATEAFKAYRDNTLPIGFVANFMGVSLDDVISHLTSSSESDGPLLTEWSNREGQDESVAAARAAETVVLTLPALITAESLGLLYQLQAFSLIAPRSLADTLREEIASAEKERVHGRKTLQSTEAGLRLFEVAPDHPLLVSRVETARQRLQWLEEHVRLEYRPLVTIRTGDPREEEARDIIGRSSYDAVALTRHLHATMYADDLGLRRFIPKGQPGRSFSTVGLVAGLAERAIITAAARDNAILALIRLRHAHIPASRGPLEMILSDTNADRSTIANAFALLGGPAETPANSARIAMQVAKAHLARDVQVVGLETIVNFALEGMARAWPRTLCTRLVAEAADAEFALLPLCRRTVKQTSIEFLKR
jgi:tetratricopeptide (TPR) repeat protein